MPAKVISSYCSYREARRRKVQSGAAAILARKRLAKLEQRFGQRPRSEAETAVYQALVSMLKGQIAEADRKAARMDRAYRDQKARIGRPTAVDQLKDAAHTKKEKPPCKKKPSATSTTR